MTGKLITLEGPEGAGKSTQITRINAWLEAKGVSVICTREPGGTKTGELIREILQHDRAGEPLCDEAELLLFNACRAQLMTQVIQPALASGTWVICDRFYDSTLAYQGYARGMELTQLKQIIDFAIAGQKPDLTLLLDIPLKVSLARQEERGEAADRFEKLGDEFHQKVRNGYLALAEANPERIRVLNADATPDIVFAQVKQALEDII